MRGDDVLRLVKITPMVKIPTHKVRGKVDGQLCLSKTWSKDLLFVLTFRFSSPRIKFLRGEDEGEGPQLTNFQLKIRKTPSPALRERVGVRATSCIFKDFKRKAPSLNPSSTGSARGEGIFSIPRTVRGKKEDKFSTFWCRCHLTLLDKREESSFPYRWAGWNGWTIRLWIYTCRPHMYIYTPLVL